MLPTRILQPPCHAPLRARALPFLASLLLAACGSGGGGTGGNPPVSGPGPGVACASASAWNGTACEPFARRITERAATSFVEGGLAVTLELVLFEPLTPGPHPVVLFHHGSTGNGDDPALFRVTVVNEPVARFFATRGWAVAFAQRRGRGTSGGLYDEGFEPDRSRYSCRQAFALPGIERALEDADAALAHVRSRPGLDPSRVLLAGHSRGGALAIAQAARRPDAVLGAVNFVGGWLGEVCGDAQAVNRGMLLRGTSSPHPSTWIYAENDPFYTVGHSRGHFDAYVSSGGRGEYRAYARAGGANGHFVADEPSLWEWDLSAFLARLPGR